MMAKIMEFQKNYTARIKPNFEEFMEIQNTNEESINQINIDNIKERTKYTKSKAPAVESYEIDIVNKFKGSIESDVYTTEDDDYVSTLIKKNKYNMQMISYIVSTENGLYNIIALNVYQNNWNYSSNDKYGIWGMLVNRIFIGKYNYCDNQAIFQSIMKYFKSGHIEFKDNKLIPLIKFDVKPKYLILPEDMGIYPCPCSKTDILYMDKTGISTLTNSKISKWEYNSIIESFKNTYYDDEHIKLRDDYDITFNIINNLRKIGFKNYKTNKFKLR